MKRKKKAKWRGRAAEENSKQIIICGEERLREEGNEKEGGREGENGAGKRGERGEYGIEE